MEVNRGGATASSRRRARWISRGREVTATSSAPGPRGHNGGGGGDLEVEEAPEAVRGDGKPAARRDELGGAAGGSQRSRAERR